MDALSAAVHAVKFFEDNPLYNSGKGAVFTRTGTIELEASVMVSSGRRKRGAAVSLIKHVKHPIELAAEILRKGDDEDAGGAQGHVHISGASAEELATKWNLELCEESHFWTRKRWQEHCKNLGDTLSDAHTASEEVRPDGTVWSQDDSGWNGHDYLPQGTVGCVVMDRYGTVAVATSTGGLTNKLPGRIGDTPTFGAGFWAEEWVTNRRTSAQNTVASTGPPTIDINASDILSTLADCLPLLNVADGSRARQQTANVDHDVHAVAMSGTGNGDSFLRLSAVRTAGALCRFATGIDLATAISWMAGPNGELQRSAGDRWHKTFEGEGGIIGIERVNNESKIVADFNCGGMFRAWYDDASKAHCEVFHESY